MPPISLKFIVEGGMIIESMNGGAEPKTPISLYDSSTRVDVS